VAQVRFGVELETTSRARLIENDGVRELVEHAERAAADDAYDRAAENLAVAFEMARRDFRVGVPDYSWFKQNFPEVGTEMRAGYEVHLYAIPLATPITRSVYLRGLDFVITTALHWQNFPQASIEDELPSQNARGPAAP
jgi:hypothetical protein